MIQGVIRARSAYPSAGQIATAFLLLSAVCLIVSSCPSFADEIYSPREQLMLMRERITRDLEYAKRLRGYTMTRKGKFEEIMKKAEQGVRDPNLDPEAYEQILRAAPIGLQNAERTLEKTEKAIRDLNTKLEQVDRNLENLLAEKAASDDIKRVRIGQGYQLGPGSLESVQLLRHGHDELIGLGKERFLPGDAIVTDTNGQVSVKTTWSIDSIVTIGRETHIRLEKDRSEGVEWRLQKGVVHCRVDESWRDQQVDVDDLGVGTRSHAPQREHPVIVTPETIVLGEEGSEFDVRVDEQGQTFVEVYQGKVEVKEPKKGIAYVVEPTGTSQRRRWWEEKGWWEVTSD